MLFYWQYLLVNFINYGNIGFTSYYNIASFFILLNWIDGIIENLF